MSRAFNSTAEIAEVYAEQPRDKSPAMSSATPSAFSAVRFARAVVLLLFLVCSPSPPALAQQTPGDSRYPAHWWTPINDPQKPEWEILPQEAKPGEVILSK